MAASSNTKASLVHLAAILENETDEHHGMTGPELIEALDRRGISIERKTLYRDIETLRLAGYDIGFVEGKKYHYCLLSRLFEDQELSLLADAVQSSRFLSASKSKALVDKLAHLTSRFGAKKLERRLYVQGRIKSQDSSAYYIIDTIQEAINLQRKISFQYVKYDLNKQPLPQRQGKTYCETPIALLYVDDEYYLVAWNDKYEDFTNYRVDRMRQVDLSPQQASSNQHIKAFDASSFLQQSFGMYSGIPLTATLEVTAQGMGAVIDKFGLEVASHPISDTHAQVIVKVTKSPTFYGWLATLGTEVRLVSPTHARLDFLRYLDTIKQNYDAH